MWYNRKQITAKKAIARTGLKCNTFYKFVREYEMGASIAISEKDIKKLWGRAAGICAFPGCGCDCLPYLDLQEPTVIGEMAHIIGRKPNAPRGVPEGGDNTYENLVLLCPTHHTMVDKAPEGIYTVDMLNKWKEDHEIHIKSMVSIRQYLTKKEMAIEIKRLLIKNKQIWKQFGPESDIALEDPLSNVAKYWSYVKISKILPNNKEIVDIINANENLIDIDDFKLFHEFIIHAEMFEQNCYTIMDKTKRFPIKFSEVVDNYAE